MEGIQFGVAGASAVEGTQFGVAGACVDGIAGVPTSSGVTPAEATVESCSITMPHRGDVQGRHATKGEGWRNVSRRRSRRAIGFGIIL